jgi:hypothetical protein
MRSGRKTTLRLWRIVAGLSMCALAFRAGAQVSPNEIVNPRLRAAQTAYFSQIKTLYKEINQAKFPFSFALGRYVGLDPGKQAESDSRGIEFVYFHERMLLKLSGNYNAAYSAELLTQNERASHAFSEVIAPTLTLVSKTIPTEVDCDGMGFEISFHVRTHSQNFDYEGKEILVVILDRADAFAFARASTDSERQEILNRSEVFLDGKEFGLALNKKDPLHPEALGRSAPPPPAPAGGASDGATSPRTGSRIESPALFPPPKKPQSHSEIIALPGGGAPAPQSRGVTSPSALALPPGDAGAPATPADADRLQSQFQAQLDALAKEGLEKHHFVNYAPPSFVIYRNQVVLQITLRNTNHFSQDSSSLYKRAAQSFDLFLATQLKDILDKVPGDALFAAYDITILNQLGIDAHAASEAIEFICPKNLLRQFVEADITNQQLIDQSVVMVNGVRISLNLQLVE